MSAVRRRVAFLHTSPAAVGPLMQYYNTAAPEFEVWNILEDGILKFFSAGDYTSAEARLATMVSAARSSYGAEAVMVTCSAVPLDLLGRLRTTAGVPLFKIDDPMARAAVQAGSRIGVAVTFPPTLGPTTKLLEQSAADQGRTLDVVARVIPGAYDALLGGDTARHDELLIGGVEDLAREGVEAVVLAQVSMARVLPQLDGRLSVPVFSSLTSSLGELRRLMT